MSKHFTNRASEYTTCELGLQSAGLSYIWPSSRLRLDPTEAVNVAYLKKLQPDCNRNHVLHAAYHVAQSRLPLRLLEDGGEGGR